MRDYNIFFFSIVAFILLVVSQSVVSQQTIPEGTQKIIIEGQTYYLHKVQKSEGLYRISVSYGVSQKEILEVNPEASSGLNEGQLIKVPVIKGRNSTKEQLQSDEFIYHTVESGQTAFFISKKYRVELKDIYDNNVGSDEQLVLGAIIKIPQSAVKPVNDNVGEGGYHVHKVEAKETIYGLSKRYGVSMDSIVNSNKGLESGILSVGSFIRIPSEQVDRHVTEVVVEQGDYEDDKFYYHKILAGETLYSISTQYNANPNEVLEANKSVNADDLPLGFLVRVPKMSVEQVRRADNINNAVLRKHKIKRKERLSDVVEKYGIPADIIEKVNEQEGIDLNQWRKGMIIKVPTLQWVEQYYNPVYANVDDNNETIKDESLSVTAVDCNAYDYSINKPSIKIAMLLPFNVAATEQVNTKPIETGDAIVYVPREKKKLSNRSKVFVEFYQGALLALESLKKEGVNVDLFVYDTAPDSVKVGKILSNPELEFVDLIIGPAYSSNLKLVSDFSKQHGIPMVYPLSAQNQEMNNNPLIFQANPTDSLMFDMMAQRIIESAYGSRVVMIRTENVNNNFEQRLSDLIRNKMYWESFKVGEVPDFVEYKFKQDDLVSLERMFDKEKMNTIIIPSIEEGQVNRIVSTLKGAVDKTEAQVTLWGLPAWMKYNTINPEDICKLNGHIFSYYAVDYTDEISLEKIDSYRHWFKTEPIAVSPYFQTASVQSNMSRYGLWGHDITYYFITAIRDYGKNFPSCIQQHRPHTIQARLNFIRVSNWGGFFNHGLFINKFNPEFNMDIEVVK